ncbi:hypothetical protein F2Q69_00002563 [Brassica cretica]|uniref:Uncharacterized protein n=1 Tax=Brassica cretica TaxID=69181 RepID=A0A8S9PA09_BRACR|nr:hypothetical protein F2Q69_00002563 [Brassica cretica]
MVFWASFMVPQKLLPGPWLNDLLLRQVLTEDSIIIRVVQDGAVRLKKHALVTTREIFQHLRTKGFGWMTHRREIYPLKIKPSRESAIEDMKEFGYKCIVSYKKSPLTAIIITRFRLSSLWEKSDGVMLPILVRKRCNVGCFVLSRCTLDLWQPPGGGVSVRVNGSSVKSLSWW